MLLLLLGGWIVLIPEFKLLVDGVEEEGRIRPGAATIVGRGLSSGVGLIRSLVLVLGSEVDPTDEGETDGSNGNRVDGLTMGVQSLLIVRRLLSSMVDDEGATVEALRSSSCCPSGDVRRILALKSG